jgi:hypothetical protein
MSHGKRAERLGHAGREYWSTRLRGMYSWGRIGKWLTHRKERAAKRRELNQLRKDHEVEP